MAHPAIRPNYLSAQLDRDTIVAGLQWARKLAAQPALAPYVESEQLPGAAAASDDDLLAFAREAGSTIYHPVGTCAMGRADDPRSVVPAIEGYRDRWLARRRCLGDAAPRVGQHQRRHDHDRRKGQRHDPGRGPQGGWRLKKGLRRAGLRVCPETS